MSRRYTNANTAAAWAPNYESKNAVSPANVEA
jgi:hypothetical protein